MPFQNNNILPLALDQLTLADVWPLARTAEPYPGPGKKCCSPFRAEKTPSFSISNCGKFFYDFGGGDEAQKKTGVWKFVELATGWEKGKIACEIIRLAGMESENQKREYTPEQKKEWREAKQREEREAAMRAATAREEALKLPVMGEIEPWPYWVGERWSEGTKYLLNNNDAQTRLAKQRGWPERWVENLVAEGKLAMPAVPWGDKNHKAFIVEYPGLGRAGKFDVLEPAGYHQRIYDIATGKKFWIYVPYIPPAEKCHNDFMRRLRSAQQAIPPLPFALGDFAHCELLLITEGEWDACTLWGALGLFNDGFEGKVAVLGVRGATGTQALLAHWGPWLRARRPAAWVWRDNDAAGQKWVARPAEKSGPALPGFLEQLSAAGCRKVVASSLKPSGTMKDFNDFYKQCTLTPDFLWTLAKKQGLEI